MRLLIKRLVIFLLPIGFATEVLATEAESGGAQRPRIGLVLSGGGARGAAHVGVIRVLEENRIPIDVIAGTSMGAIVGGLYASGMSVDEIDHTIRTIDWDDALSDKSKRRRELIPWATPDLAAARIWLLGVGAPRGERPSSR